MQAVPFEGMADIVYLSSIDLTFYECIRQSITVCVNRLALIQANGFRRVQLTSHVSHDFYRQIANNSSCNLKTELRISPANVEFLSDRPIQLELTLRPDLLPMLLDHAQTAEAAAAYLQTLSQQQSEQLQSLQSTAEAEQTAEHPEDPEPSIHPLLYTENWFCLSVKQQQDYGEIGYSTFWSYVNPALLSQSVASSDQIAEGVTNLFKDWTTANLTAATQDITEELFKGVSGLFEGFDTWLDQAFSKDDEGDEEDIDDTDDLLETVIDFFTEDDWTFTKLQGQSTLQVTCQGKNGRWNCYALAREDQEQFVFYSIYPNAAPEDKRLVMAEFLTRANYGLIIGNFEMDFNDGEIRYKTSIVVEGDLLTTDLIKQLVYGNVMMMDHYFPGIQAVINGSKLPMEAIMDIEVSGASAGDSSTDELNC